MDKTKEEKNNQLKWTNTFLSPPHTHNVGTYLCVPMRHLADIEIGGAGNEKEEGMDAKENWREGRGILRAGGGGEEGGGGGEEEEEGGKQGGEEPEEQDNSARERYRSIR